MGQLPLWLGLATDPNAPVSHSLYTSCRYVSVEAQSKTCQTFTKPGFTEPAFLWLLAAACFLVLQ